jgi:nicotinamidase-related amidase
MAERVWDKFLSEQDLAHVKLSDHQGGRYGNRPALLLIDLYRWVFGDKSQPLLEAVQEWPGSCGPAAWESLPYIQSLLAAAREASIPVIHLTGLEGSGVPAWNIHHKLPKVDEDTPEAKDRRRRRYDIVSEVAPILGEAVLYKTAPSAFWGTPLVGHLTALGVDTIITVGESTSGCVRASVVDGCTYRYKMIVVEEGVFDRHEASHAINLFDMDQKYADVVPLQEVEEYLRAWKDGAYAGV